MERAGLRKTLWELLVELAFDGVGSFAFAVGMQMFIAPNQIAPGGVSGLAVVLNYLTRVPIGVWSFFINIPLLLVGLRFLGRRFALRTLKTVVVLSVMIDYAAAPLPAYTGDPLLAALFGGVLKGAGWRSSSCAAPRRAAAISSPGCSSSGIPISRSADPDVDRRGGHPHFGGGLRAHRNGPLRHGGGLYRLQVIDGILYGMDTGSSSTSCRGTPQTIAKRVMAELERGCTLLKSTGAFTQSDAQVLLVAVRRQQYHPLKKIIHEVDPRPSSS
ncbi:MAG: YitT family protein [Anaerotruncus massiliensis (ex Togo et al. 2019)]